MSRRNTAAGRGGGVEWYRCDSTRDKYKKPIAYSTEATMYYIEILTEDNPSATIAEIQAMMHYCPDGKEVLQKYIDLGQGDEIASRHFRRYSRYRIPCGR